MFKKIILMSFFLFGLGNAEAQYNGSGPGGCLVDKELNGPCPNDFLENVICWMDDSVCYAGLDEYPYRLRQFKYYFSYYQIIAEALGMPVQYRDYLNLDTETKHALYEYNICLLDGESCYLVNGDLTIYAPPVEPTASCPDPDRSCHGGPSDAAICQRMPEACTGISGH